MDVITLLKKDHKDVKGLFNRFARSSRPETLKSLAQRIVHELSVHAAVEEQFVYPMLRMRARDGGPLADHSIEEHAEVKKLLADVEKASPDSAEFRRKMDQVIQAARHHIHDEEKDLLPRLAEGMTHERLELMGSIVERAKSVVPTHPHPLVPGTATAQLVAGPWASIIDHMRDLLTAA